MIIPDSLMNLIATTVVGVLLGISQWRAERKRKADVAEAEKARIELLKKAKEVHALVNGQRLGLLQTNLTSAMALYEATKKPEHKELLEAAQRDLDTQKQALEHEKAIANGGTK